MQRWLIQLQAAVDVREGYSNIEASVQTDCFKVVEDPQTSPVEKTITNHRRRISIY